MRVIKPSAIRAFYEKHSDAESWLKIWLLVVRKAAWQNLTEVRRTYPSADAVTLPSGNTVTIFNSKGNHYRLIVAIHYNTQRLYIRDFLTHAEYDSNRWKKVH